MKLMMRYLIILPFIALMLAIVPQAEQAEAQCLRVSRGTVLLRKVGSRYRMSGRNFYFNMSCSGRIGTGYGTLASGRYCIGSRIGNSRGGRCTITSIYVLRSSRTGLPMSTSEVTSKQACWSAE